MKNKSSMVLWLALILVTFASSSASAAIVFDPASKDVTVGDSFSIDVVISGLGAGIAPSVGGFDLSVGYDPGIVTPTGVVFGPFLGDPLLFEALTGFGGAPGSLDFFEISLLPFFDLDALQPDSFTLATLLFDATGIGVTDLTFAAGLGGIALADAFGLELAPDFGPAAPITSAPKPGEDPVIPEPGTLVLFGSALGWYLCARGRQRQPRRE